MRERRSVTRLKTQTTRPAASRSLTQANDLARVGPSSRPTLRPPKHSHRHILSEIISNVLSPQLDELNWSPERTAHVIRLVTFSASFPQINEGTEFTSRELAKVILYGIAGKPTARSHTTTSESQD